MAVNINVIGRLGCDSKLIAMPQGDFLSFRLAVDSYWNGVETTDWFRVAYGNTKLVEWLKKGKLVNVIGEERIKIKAKPNGEVHVDRDIHAHDVQFVHIARPRSISAATETIEDDNIGTQIIDDSGNTPTEIIESDTDNKNEEEIDPRLIGIDLPF